MEKRRIHLFIKHEEPINKNFYLKLLRITLTLSKNQGCQEKKLNLGITKTRLLRKKIEDKHNKNQGCQEKIEVRYNKNQGCLEKKLRLGMTKIKAV